MIEAITFKAVTEFGIEFDVQENRMWRYFINELKTKRMVMVTRAFVNDNFERQYEFFEIASEYNFSVQWHSTGKFFTLRRYCPECGEEH